MTDNDEPEATASQQDLEHRWEFSDRLAAEIAERYAAEIAAARSGPDGWTDVDLIPEPQPNIVLAYNHWPHAVTHEANFWEPRPLTTHEAGFLWWLGEVDSLGYLKGPGRKRGGWQQRPLDPREMGVRYLQLATTPPPVTPRLPDPTPRRTWAQALDWSGPLDRMVQFKDPTTEIPWMTTDPWPMWSVAGRRPPQPLRPEIVDRINDGIRRYFQQDQ